MSENVIILSNWKNAQEEKVEENSIRKYYQLLRFDQLISESKELRKLIVQGKNINELSLKTKFIFEEIQNRMICSNQKEDVQRFGHNIQGL